MEIFHVVLGERRQQSTFMQRPVTAGTAGYLLDLIRGDRLQIDPVELVKSFKDDPPNVSTINDKC